MSSFDGPGLRFSEIDSSWETRQRVHEVPHLLRRWRAVAKSARMGLSVIHCTENGPVYFLRSHKVTRRPVYVSAGVHGDEAAAVAGLLEWAEQSVAQLREADLVLVPLFNPEGLARNTRTNLAGEDLNRLFDHPDHPHITGWRTAMAEFTPRIGVCLHEDYDAQGLYGYELNRNRGLHLAGDFLQAVSPILPWDIRRTIEGMAARQGVIRRRRIALRGNLPEAVVLYQEGTPCTLTFETPSEFSLAARVRVQACLVDEVIRRDAARNAAE